MSHFIDAFDFEQPKQSLDLLFEHLKASTSTNAEIQSFLLQKYNQEEKSLSDLEKQYLKFSSSLLTESFVKFESGCINQRRARNRGLQGLSDEFKSYIEGSEWMQIGVSIKKGKYDPSFVKQTKDLEDKMGKAEKYKKQASNGSRNFTIDKAQKKLQSAVEDLAKAREQWNGSATALLNNANDLSVEMVHFEAEEFIHNICQEKGNKEGRANVAYARKDQKSLDRIPTKSAVDADGQSIPTPHVPNYSITGSLTPSNAAVVDAEGYTIKPNNDNDIFKANFGGDEDFQRKVINVSIQEEVIMEDESATSSAIKNMNEQLQKPPSIRK
ncbi:hypothetical protein HDV01_000284 [Terramyces sp. JEL0728]|nr:hypothetical protein HDV01_000284 [Terramyces sp. JEL0728]